MKAARQREVVHILSASRRRLLQILPEVI